MFVINTNGDNSGYSCVSVNGEYNPPMDGSFYTLFDNGNCRTYCFNALFCYTCQCEGASGTPTCNITYTKSGWNGCDENSDSPFDYAKVSDLNENVYFPNNITGCVGSCREFYQKVQTNFDTCLLLSCGCTGTINYTIPEQLVYSLATMKQFPAGLCIGRKMRGYIGALICDCSRYNSCSSANCYSSIARTGPLCYYISYGLLHTDGTIDNLYCCDIITSTGCFNNDVSPAQLNSTGCGCGVISRWGTCPWYSGCKSFSNPNINILYGERNLPGLTTREGDRIIFRVGINCSQGTLCAKGYACSTPNLCTSLVLYGGSHLHYGLCGRGPNRYCGKDVLEDTTCKHCALCAKIWQGTGTAPEGLTKLCTYRNSIDDECRFIGVQFSIE